MKYDNPKTYYSLCQVHKKLGQKQEVMNVLMDGFAVFYKLGDHQQAQEFRRRVNRYSQYVTDRSIAQLAEEFQGANVTDDGGEASRKKKQKVQQINPPTEEGAHMVVKNEDSNDKEPQMPKQKEEEEGKEPDEKRSEQQSTKREEGEQNGATQNETSCDGLHEAIQKEELRD